MIASVPQHPLLRFLLSCLGRPFEDWADPRFTDPMKLVLRFAGQPEFSDPALDLISRTGPGFFTRATMTFVGRLLEQPAPDTEMLLNLFIAPTPMFYPVPNKVHASSREEVEGFVQPMTLAIHHWASSWQ
eukprot:GILI01022853.1.p4 GENE.GILI01022853.1~~GILI01022853.1.p4  ORF type:complete len:130 (+),score=30.18 GILI01022853.1:625-1014(+)